MAGDARKRFQRYGVYDSMGQNSSRAEDALPPSMGPVGNYSGGTRPAATSGAPSSLRASLAVPSSAGTTPSMAIPPSVGKSGAGPLASSAQRTWTSQNVPGSMGQSAPRDILGTSPHQSTLQTVGSLPNSFPGTPASPSHAAAVIGSINSTVSKGSIGTGSVVGSVTSQGMPDNKKVPAVFRWTHGGHKVYVTGSFNGWKEKIPLTRSGEDFVAILNLPVGCHYYKYIVDDSWKYDHDQTTAMDTTGNINNFLEVCLRGGWDDNDGDQDGEDLSEYEQRSEMFVENKKNPPLLPPHLRYTPLNCATNQREDYEATLPVPQQVTLNHVYFSKRPWRRMTTADGNRSSILAMGMSTRYRQKFVTTVLYKRVVEGSSEQKDDMEILAD